MGARRAEKIGVNDPSPPSSPAFETAAMNDDRTPAIAAEREGALAELSKFLSGCPTADLCTAREEAVLDVARVIVNQKVSAGGPGVHYMPPADQIRDFLRLEIPDYEIERGGMIGLDSNGRVLGIRVLTRGARGSTHVSIREIFRAALEQNAAGIITWHTHPGVSALPSREDLLVLQLKLRMAPVLEIFVHDDVILARGGEFYSAQSAGMLDSKSLAAACRIMGEQPLEGFWTSRLRVILAAIRVAWCTLRSKCDQ